MVTDSLARVYSNTLTYAHTLALSHTLPNFSESLNSHYQETDTRESTHHCSRGIIFKTSFSSFYLIVISQLQLFGELTELLFPNIN